MPVTRPITTRDLPFPAVVTAPDGRFWAMARLVVVGGELVVVEHVDGKTRIGARVQIVASTLPGPRRQGETLTWRVIDADGDWIITKGAGCGCGHPLKRANLQRLLARA